MPLVELCQRAPDVGAAGGRRIRQDSETDAGRDSIPQTAQALGDVFEVRVQRRFAVTSDGDPVDHLSPRGRVFQSCGDDGLDSRRPRPPRSFTAIPRGAARPAVLAIRAVHVAHLASRRQQVDAERPTKTAAAYGSIHNTVDEGDRHAARACKSASGHIACVVRLHRGAVAGFPAESTSWRAANQGGASCVHGFSSPHFWSLPPREPAPFSRRGSPELVRRAIVAARVPVARRARASATRAAVTTAAADPGAATRAGALWAAAKARAA